MRIQQLTVQEQSLIDEFVRKSKGSAADALKRVSANRCKRGIRQLEKSAAHRFVKGGTHKRNAEETRGRKSLLTKKHVLKLDQARRRLIIKANNENRVTYSITRPSRPPAH